MRARWHAAAIAYALGISLGLSTVAGAGSVTQPGETVGIATAPHCPKAYIS